MGFPNNDQTGVGMALENVGEQCAGSLTSGVGVNYIDLSLGRFERAQIGLDRMRSNSLSTSG